MSSALPEWARSMAGVAVDGDDWLPILCTGRGCHAPTLLGLIFEHGQRGGVHYGGPGVGHSRRRLNHRERALNEAEPTDSLRKPLGPTRPGSINVECRTCGLCVRLARHDWNERVERAWDSRALLRAGLDISYV